MSAKFFELPESTKRAIWAALVARWAVADPAGLRQRPGRAEGRQQGGEAEKKGGRGIDKASDCLLSLSPKPKALSC